MYSAGLSLRHILIVNLIIISLKTEANQNIGINNKPRSYRHIILELIEIVTMHTK